MRIRTWDRIEGEQGFTLIELMVTMIVALLTVAAMMGVFSIGQRLYRTQEQVSDTQQNVRVSVDAIARDLRMANFGPCGAAVTSVVGGGIQLLPITHVNGAGAVPDQVTIMYADGNTEMNVTVQMPSVAAALFVDDSSQVQVDDVVIVTNCTNSDVVQVTGPACLPGCGTPEFVHSAGGGSLNDTAALSTSYGPGSKVYKVKCVRYRVDTVNARLLMETGGSVCETPGAGAAPAVGNSVVLAENVEGLELAYGLDTDGPDADGNGCADGNGTIDTWINAFTPATQACQVSQIRAVRVSVLTRTGTPQKDFSYPATTAIEDKVYPTLAGTESQRRRVLTTEVKPRNIGIP